jgi:DNA helicase IV
VTSEVQTVFRPNFLAGIFLSPRWELVLDLKSNDNARLFLGDVPHELACLDIASIRTTKSWFWHAVELGEGGQIYRLSGLSEKAAENLAAALYTFVNSSLFSLIEREQSAIRKADPGLRQDQYLARSDLERAIARVPTKVGLAVRHPLFDPELMPDALRATLPPWLGLLIDPELRHEFNNAFVAAEHVAFQVFFDDLDGRSLSLQQREACIRLEDNNLLVACAGSGKSATMVGKLAYALAKELYKPDEILLLAFNKSAADELRTRIAKQLKVEENALECRVTTFHALGRGIIQEVTGRPPQLANWIGHPAGETKFLDAIISSLFESDQEFASHWTELLVVHPKADIAPQHFDRQVDYDRYVAAQFRGGQVTIGTHAGKYVKSLQEQKIANWLWLNSVEFEYEKQVAVEDESGSPRHLHPDFYYPQTGTIHEHFALNADGTSPFADYVTQAEVKRQSYGLNEIDFFETTSAQASDGTLIDVLKAALSARGYVFKRRDYADIQKALEPVLIEHYHKIISTCIKHIRARRLTLDALLELAETLHDKARAELFARVVWAITKEYSKRLERAKEIDFDSMIADAVRLIETGKFQSPYSLILVDEFQDISEPRANLIKALRKQHASCKVFAVGDDWQSIYRFAGSDIGLFTQFEAHFGEAWTGRLEQTYRCNQLIAQTAAEFVQRNPAQLKKSVRSNRDAIPRSIRVIPIGDKDTNPNYAEACQALLQRLDKGLGNVSDQWRTKPGHKLKALVLWRYNRLDPFAGRVPSFENIEVVGMSFHRAKGLEADYVILLDVSEGDYGVPSQIEDDELLNLVICYSAWNIDPSLGEIGIQY